LTRVLHTSDWHLGATLGDLSRDAEHALFLDWLLAAIESESIDVLLVAGDVFHQAQPSADSQRRYYRFLAALRETRLLRTIVIGGNHDSQSRLDAPRELLDSLDVSVVGGLESLEDPRLAVVVSDRSGAPVLGVAAVPFVHEYRLGVRLHAAPGDIAADMRARFEALYSQVADQLQNAAPGAPLIAMGHLTCGDAERGWVGDEIHSVGGSYVLGPDIFDARYSYVALGHIHRCYPVDPQRRVWYSGSPVGIRDKELREDRAVLVFDVGDGGVGETRKLPVPRFREIFEVAGALDEVVRAIEKISSDAELPPGVLITVNTNVPLPSADDTIRQALERFAPDRRPIRCMATRFVRPVTNDVANPGDRAPIKLGQLTPEQVFIMAFDAEYGEAPTDADLIRFRSLLGEES
jgi:exonuclease SbcD